jgi:arylformamidase
MTRHWLVRLGMGMLGAVLVTTPILSNARDDDGLFPALWQAASPFDALAHGAAPMLLVCSTQRADGSCSQSQNFAAQAASKGVRAIVSPQDLSHGEINATLGLPGSETDAVQAFFESIGLGAH